MATPSLKLIDALRQASKRISNKDNYDWRKVGSCNCGNVVQVITNYSKKDLNSMGLEKQADWEMLVKLYQKGSGYKIDEVIGSLVDIGLTLDDISDLENLKSNTILSKLPSGTYLKRDRRKDVILYMRTWANILEEELLKDVELSEVKTIFESKGSCL